MHTSPISRNRVSSAEVLLAGVAFTLALVAAVEATSHDDSLPHGGHPPLHAQDTMRAFADEHHHDQQLSAQSITACTDGMAGTYPCSNVDLMAFLPLSQIGGGEGNDIWGWTDSGSGREFAIMGTTTHTAFVEITDSANPVYLGKLNLPGGVAESSWRDIKVYNDHAYIGSEALGSGMQVMSLAQLLNVPAPPVIFAQLTNYEGFSTSHNIVINEDTGYAYGVGINNNNCGRGLHFVDIIAPANPVPAGCFADDGYTHDAQCVVYGGSDPDYQGLEICFAYNEDTLTIVDVSDKNDPMQISRTSYVDQQYTHQGWLTDDHDYLLMDDELDEGSYGIDNTRTLIWDVRDLDNPIHMANYAGVSTSRDHNQYVKGDYVYQANYTSGLRVLDISDIANGNLVEVGFFDIYPLNNLRIFSGAWSTYPFFDSGTVIVSGIEQGLFILKPKFVPEPHHAVMLISGAALLGALYRRRVCVSRVH